MRKVLAAVLVALALVAGAPGAAHASPQPKFAPEFRGVSVFDFSTPACSFVHQIFTARFVDSLGGWGRLRIEGCVDGVTFAFDGTFQIENVHGTQRGAVAGDIGTTAGHCPSGGRATLDFVLTPRAGRPRHLVGLWCTPAVPDVPGPIRGTISA
jgi:hypothetical protein